MYIHININLLIHYIYTTYIYIYYEIYYLLFVIKTLPIYYLSLSPGTLIQLLYILELLQMSVPPNVIPSLILFVLLDSTESLSILLILSYL